MKYKTIKENQNTEFKVSWRDEYLKVLSAFANSKGGTLYIGVDDYGKPVGIPESQRKKLLESLPNKIRNRLNITPMVSEEKYKGFDIIKIQIDSAGFRVPFEGKFYNKVGSTVQELTGLELSAFLLEKSGKTWDGLPIEADIDELDIDTIELFKTLAQKRLPHIEQEKDVRLLLSKLKLIDDDNKLTRASILLFGKDPRKHFFTAYTRVGRFKTEIDILDTVDIEGNLFQQFEQTVEAIKKHLNVRFDTSVKEYSIGGFSRRDIWDYPLDAIREIIANALIHKDYLDTSPIQIKVYDDKITFWNSGKLLFPLTVESLKTEHPVRQRNPLLASVFYYAGIVEQWGSGTLKIIRLFREQGLPEPEFVEKKEGIGDFTVYIYKDRFNVKELRKMGLNERQIKAVLYVKEKGKITNKEYQELTQVSRQTATRDLQELVEKSIFIMHGAAKREIYYQLSQK